MILLISRQGSEQVVQLLAQMAFDGAQLGVPDRNPLGPIVRDRHRPALLDGPPEGRRSLRTRLHIVGQIVETVRHAERERAVEGMSLSVRVDFGGSWIFKK